MTHHTARPTVRRYLSALVIAFTALAVYLGAAHTGATNTQVSATSWHVVDGPLPDPEPQGRTWA